MKELKERRRKWTDVPNPKCRLCKSEKMHTKAQHDLSVKRYNEKYSMLDFWNIRVTSIK